MILSTLYGEIHTEEDFEEKIPLEIGELLNSSMAILFDQSENLPSRIKYFNAQSAITNLNIYINDWENWLIAEHNEIITRVTKSKQITSSKWLLNKIEFRWLRDNIAPQIKTVETLYIQFGNALIDYEDYYRSNYGLKGIIDTFFGVFKNPTETAKDILGNQEHKTETTVLNLEKRLKSSHDQLINQLVSTFRDVFIYKTIVYINEIISHIKEEG